MAGPISSSFSNILAVASEPLGDLVEPHVLAPVHAGLRRRLFESALVDPYLEPPLVVDADHTHQRQILTRGGFQFGDVEKEGGVAGERPYRTFLDGRAVTAARREERNSLEKGGRLGNNDRSKCDFFREALW